MCKKSILTVLLISIGLCWASSAYGASAAIEDAPQAALIVANTDLSAGFDGAMYDRLTSMGYAVTVATGDDVKNDVFTVADAETFDVLVVSESISSSAADNLIGANVPMMHQESYGWDNHLLINKTDSIWVNDANAIVMDIVNDVHPIIVDANLPVGPLQFYIDDTVVGAERFTTELVSALVPGAENIAQINYQDNVYTLVFAIEQGSELADGTPAADRIVGFSIPGHTDITYDANQITDDGWALFDAAIRWLDPAPVSIPAMVAHWTMDDGAGTVVTDAVGANDGTIVGNVAWIDGAVSFDVNDPNAAIIVPNSVELDFGDVDFSISLMVRYPITPGVIKREHQLVLKGSFGGDTESGSRYVLFYKDTNLRFEIDNGPANAKSGPSATYIPVLDEWIHIVAVRDAQNDVISIYADGVLLATAVDNSGDISSGEDLYIGNSLRNGATSEADIDDVRIYPVALTKDEIAAIASQ